MHRSQIILAASLIVLSTSSQGLASGHARDRSQVYSFRSDNPCPVTERTRGPCPGWVVDHIIPLCAGGDDKPANMQWQPRDKAREKDLIEIRYCRCLSREIGPCR